MEKLIAPQSEFMLQMTIKSSTPCIAINQYWRKIQSVKTDKLEELTNDCLHLLDFIIKKSLPLQHQFLRLATLAIRHHHSTVSRPSPQPRSTAKSVLFFVSNSNRFKAFRQVGRGG